MKNFKNVDKTTWMAIGGALFSAIMAFAGAMGEHKKEVEIDKRFKAIEDRLDDSTKKEEA